MQGKAMEHEAPHGHSRFAICDLQRPFPLMHVLVVVLKSRLWRDHLRLELSKISRLSRIRENSSFASEPIISLVNSFKTEKHS